MALPWNIPLESIDESKYNKEWPQPSMLKHFCNLNIHENPIEELQTGLMCDIGIYNMDTLTIQRLIASGMTVAKLNVRDLDPDICAQLVQSIRQAVYNYSIQLDYVYPLALLIEIRGPDIITGDLKGGPRATVELTENQLIRLTTDASWRDSGTADCLYVAWDHLTDLHTGDVLYIDSLTPGRVKIVVAVTGDDSVEGTVVTNGTIGCKMPIRVSCVPREIEIRSDKGDSTMSSSNSDVQPLAYMEQQISWAVASDLDALLVPNTQTVSDIRQVKDILNEKGKHILIFACIDTELGLDNIDNILSEADGIYLDRSLLITDIPVEKVFIAQKLILAKCKYMGKPCICKAVVNEQIPTLCVTDIANLVLDNVDVLALEIQYDSPIKKIAPTYDAVRIAEHCLVAASVICRQSEYIQWQPRVYGVIELMQRPLAEPSKAVCVSAVELANRSLAVVIICLTSSGRTAKLLSHADPACPIVAVTRICNTARQLRFWRGVRTLHYFEAPKDNWMNEVEYRVRTGLNYCKAKRIMRAGDAYIVVSGSRRGVGYCDSVRLLFASAREASNLE